MPVRQPWEPVHPRDRVRIVVATAHAVIEGRLDPASSAATLRLQQSQIASKLRVDRIDVTQSEASDVATSLRRLAEQVSECEAPPDGSDDLVESARILGELAQILR
jgi:hypothetical protein